MLGAMVSQPDDWAAERARPATRRPLSEAARERRRREIRLRRRRRDLLVDVALGLAIAVLALSLAPGLGVIALVAVPVFLVAVVIRCVSAVRHRRARRSPDGSHVPETRGAGEASGQRR